MFKCWRYKEGRKKCNKNYISKLLCTKIHTYPLSRHDRVSCRTLWVYGLSTVIRFVCANTCFCCCSCTNIYNKNYYPHISLFVLPADLATYSRRRFLNYVLFFPLLLLSSVLIIIIITLLIFFPGFTLALPYRVYIVYI